MSLLFVFVCTRELGQFAHLWVICKQFHACNKLVQITIGDEEVPNCIGFESVHHIVHDCSQHNVIKLSKIQMHS